MWPKADREPALSQCELRWIRRIIDEKPHLLRSVRVWPHLCAYWNDLCSRYRACLTRRVGENGTGIPRRAQGDARRGDVPAAVLDGLKAIERELGRVDRGRWAPRTIDIDLLLYGRETLATDRLRVPHPGMTERAFVLTPLAALEPRLTIPGEGPRTVLDHARAGDQHLPLWMGIVNLPPDWFSDGGELVDDAAVEARVAKLVGDGAEIIDLGAESTRQTIERARAAAIGGADAVLCVAPHYYGAAMNDAALRAHYHAVADASPKPVVLYTIPKYMHFALSAPLVAELARHPNVIGIKDSSGDPAILAGYLQAQSDTFTVLTGNGAQFLNALRAGARGGILAVALFAPMLARTVFESHKAGRTADADAAQAKLTPLAVEIVGKMGIGAIKIACEATGFVGGPVRGPLTNPDDTMRRRVLELLDASGLQRKAPAAA